jgi:hypothetical protein
MGAKQIVFSPNGLASATSSMSANLTTFDYIMIVLLLVLVAISVYYIATTQKTMYKIEEKFSSKPKYKIVYLYMNGCPYCVKFDKTHSEVSNDIEITKRFIIEEKIDIKSSSADQYKEHKCDGFPCYMVIDSKSGDVIKQATGYRSSDDFKMWLSSV